jgi:tRNA (cmo5U34)-methyltransferase
MNALSRVFDEAAAGYDNLRSKVIPCFEEFYEAVARLIPCDPRREFAVLDLGAGTGLLTAIVRAAFPRSSITALDQSAGMLQRLRERFADDSRVSSELMDYSVGPLPTGQDVIVSALSIHHLDDAGKQRLFRAILDSLQPGGMFINADLVRGATERVERHYQDYWRKRLEAGGISRRDLEGVYQRMQYDKTSPLEAQLIWLRTSGFVDVDCYYKYNNFAVYAGRRPGEADSDAGSHADS